MRTTTFSVLIIPLLTLACVSQEDQCLETREALAFTEASSWGITPADAYAHVDGPRAGTLTWNGGGSLGEMSPSSGTSGFSLSTTLHTDSAIAVDLEHVGDGRLACSDTIEVQATLTLVSEDGAFDEQLEISLSATDGTLANEVIGEVDLSDYAWSGTFDWDPESATGQLYLSLAWTNDAPQTVRGRLIWNDVKAEELDGNMVTNTGSGRVLAEFEATE
jgi:hypothetical protein